MSSTATAFAMQKTQCTQQSPGTEFVDRQWTTAITIARTLANIKTVRAQCVWTNEIVVVGKICETMCVAENALFGEQQVVAHVAAAWEQTRF